MHRLLKRIITLTAPLIFTVGCGDFKSSPPPQQKPQESQKVVPTLFKIKCRAIMNPDSNSNANPIMVKTETEVFRLTDFSTNVSRIKISTGPFTLISKVIEEARDHEVVLEPAFCFELLTGSATETPRCDKGMSLQGLFDRTASLPFTRSSGLIVDFTYQGQKISYLSFECELNDGEDN